MCARVLLEEALSHSGHPSFKPSCNYMVAYEGVGAKLAEQLVITVGEKESLNNWMPSSTAQGPLCELL